MCFFKVKQRMKKKNVQIIRLCWFRNLDEFLVFWGKFLKEEFENKYIEKFDVLERKCIDNHECIYFVLGRKIF